MDLRSPRDEETEVDLESGLLINEDDSNKVSTPGSAKQTQTKTPFANLLGGIAGNTINGEDRPTLYNSESNLSGVPVTDVEKVTNKFLAGQDLVDREDKTPVKEKRKKSSNRKASKPPRPPRGPSLDAADQKFIKEISELAMLKRARIERTKALKKMKANKASSSSSHSSIFAMIFTIIFCIVIIWQGLSFGKSPVASFQGSPMSRGGTDGGLISFQYHLNPSASNSNAPGSESQNFVRQVAGSDAKR